MSMIMCILYTLPLNQSCQIGMHPGIQNCFCHVYGFVIEDETLSSLRFATRAKSAGAPVLSS